MKLDVFYAVVIFVSVVSCIKSESSENEEDTFVPTDEWKIVKKGQKIPEGLHIRINLETGVTEAKLISKEKPKNALTMIENAENDGDEEKLKFSPAELKEALKNIRSDEPAKAPKKSYRNYDELKKDFDDLNLNPKTESEIMKELVEKHIELIKHQDYDEEEILTILEDLEYLVHQYDNANDFVQLDGFKTIVYKNLNSTNSEIRRETLKLLGASMQNNIKVKIHAVETGAIDILLRILALDPDISVKYRALFALSGLLRDFPFAQLQLVENAGLSVFSKLFESNNLKIQLKMTTLINDLLQEEIDSRKDEEQEEKTKQYQEVDLRGRLIQNNYCEHLNNLIVNSVVIEANDHDIIEKCLSALYSVIDECLPILTQKSKDIVFSLRNLYKKLSEKEKDSGSSSDSHDYFSVLYDISNRIVKKYGRIKFEL